MEKLVHKEIWLANVDNSNFSEEVDGYCRIVASFPKLTQEVPIETIITDRNPSPHQPTPMTFKQSQKSRNANWIVHRMNIVFLRYRPRSPSRTFWHKFNKWWRILFRKRRHAISLSCEFQTKIPIESKVKETGKNRRGSSPIRIACLACMCKNAIKVFFTISALGIETSEGWTLC